MANRGSSAPPPLGVARARLRALGLLACQRVAGAFAGQCPLFLGQGSGIAFDNHLGRLSSRLKQGRTPRMAVRIGIADVRIAWSDEQVEAGSGPLLKLEKIWELTRSNCSLSMPTA